VLFAISLFTFFKVALESISEKDLSKKKEKNGLANRIQNTIGREKKDCRVRTTPPRRQTAGEMVMCFGTLVPMKRSANTSDVKNKLSLYTAALNP